MAGRQHKKNHDFREDPAKAVFLFGFDTKTKMDWAAYREQCYQDLKRKYDVYIVRFDIGYRKEEAFLHVRTPDQANRLRSINNYRDTKTGEPLSRLRLCNTNIVVYPYMSRREYDGPSAYASNHSRMQADFHHNDFTDYDNQPRSRSRASTNDDGCSLAAAPAGLVPYQSNSKNVERNRYDSNLSRNSDISSVSLENSNNMSGVVSQDWTESEPENTEQLEDPQLNRQETMKAKETVPLNNLTDLMSQITVTEKNVENPVLETQETLVDNNISVTNQNILDTDRSGIDSARCTPGIIENNGLLLPTAVNDVGNLFQTNGNMPAQLDGAITSADSNMPHPNAINMNNYNQIMSDVVMNPNYAYSSTSRSNYQSEAGDSVHSGFDPSLEEDIKFQKEMNSYMPEFFWTLNGHEEIVNGLRAVYSSNKRDFLAGVLQVSTWLLEDQRRTQNTIQVFNQLQAGQYSGLRTADNVNYSNSNRLGFASQYDQNALYAASTNQMVAQQSLQNNSVPPVSSGYNTTQQGHIQSTAMPLADVVPESSQQSLGNYVQAPIQFVQHNIYLNQSQPNTETSQK